MNRSSTTALATLALAALGVAGSTAQAATAVAAGAGTLGLNGTFNFSLTDTLVGRVGYGGLRYSGTVNDTNASYSGQLRLSNGTAIVDWHPGRHSFKLSLGGVASGTRIDVAAVPTGGSFELGSTSYTTMQVGSVTGSIKPSKKFAPYVGIGFGSSFGDDSRLSFVLDAGVVLSGAPIVALTATCAQSLPASACAQIQQDAAAEIANLRDSASQFKAWPVLNVGLAWRL
jgi:hypothetical protein